MIDSAEWKALPLEDRLIELVSHAEDTLVRDVLAEALRRLGETAALRQRCADLQSEITRLERLAAAPTPY